MAIGYSQNFGMERKIIATALNAFSRKRYIQRQELMRLLGVGDNKAEATVTWLGYLGLRDNMNSELTAFGNSLLTFDPNFEDPITQWVFHYKLASNPEAEVWYVLTNEFLPNRTRFSSEDAIDFLASNGLRSKNDKHLRSDVSIFLRSFISKEALGKTEYLKTESQPKRTVSQNKFYKNPPSSISPYLVAYVIFDQRENNSPNLSTITIQELLDLKGNVGRVFSLNRKGLEEVLRLLSSSQHDRLVDLSTTAGLDQVGLMFKGRPLDILEMYYIKREKDETF
ncbi:hypothetical protein HKBW3S44_00171 [Candidatus Hakubella thermalkaliphila]|uniref:DUF4007 domain-containing protein n=2 Tax=Candidatus Hakubella thermalkaliphila TaxID=2754717 RepID=A0A6V8PAK7_9ACTN|nr:DUF4007 family protein [Candidatus Hakubella thermalkaliphila]MBT9166795.1 hypothetical protein [Bacillota bacterium]GFP22602.1 hypothetical protein HKBW3S09_00070 [Candidatus Hakubella thermalkaliphila]GFP29712.1 hypothetical protein HKBW3S34_00632 [Candidatus Hakubella thermalkaliphila]GFP36488.1 hypothetical protein HKBW3S44_00171 [Candidatus Hakubella thermalkaliphila]GFP39033.1 hypothetical protein HKBW3S47_00733 [Candidatus Hakubella thermalkaliphila]